MKMKSILLTLLFAACLIGRAHAQDPDCKKFRNGRFVYPTLPGKVSWRKDTIQESYNNGNLEMVWNVKWLSDCQYVLTCEKNLVESYPIKVGDRIDVTIVKTTETCFTSTLIYYSPETPDGEEIPGGEMCFEKKK